MELAAAIKFVGFGAVAVLVLSWLVVSFARSDQVQARVSWLAATCLYLALASLFLSLCMRAWEEDAMLVLVAFGFLLFVFVSGFCVSLVRTLGAFLRSGSAGSHATH